MIDNARAATTCHLVTGRSSRNICRDFRRCKDTRRSAPGVFCSILMPLLVSLRMRRLTFLPPGPYRIPSPCITSTFLQPKSSKSLSGLSFQIFEIHCDQYLLGSLSHFLCLRFPLQPTKCPCELSSQRNPPAPAHHSLSSLALSFERCSLSST